MAIKDIAVQRFFYSQPSSDGSKTLDDEITEYESALGIKLIQLRSIPIDSAVDAAVAAEVIAHLAPRTANVRRIFTAGTKQLLTAVEQAFSDEDTFVRMLGLDVPVPNDVWHAHMAGNGTLKSLLELVPFPKEFFDRFIFMACKEGLAGKFDPNRLGITQLFSTLQKGLEDVVRNSHNKGLKEGLVPEVRRAALAELGWRICAAPSEGAILPDCVAIGLVEESKTFLPYTMVDAATTSAVIMPITSDKLLVGTRPGHAAPALENFNIEGAGCSEELFIAASNLSVFTELRTLIGKRWKSEIDVIVHDALKELRSPKTQSDDSEHERPPLTPLSFELKFFGFGDMDITPLRERTERIVSLIRSLFDLSRLDGITFAAPFQRGLDELDRGFEIETSPEGVPDHLAQGVATAIVMRDGLPKIRIVLSAEYGLSLVGDDLHAAEVGLHLLAAGLAQVCTLAQIEDALPGFLMKSVTYDDHEGLLHYAFRKALRAYRYARASAGFGADDFLEEVFSKYAIHSLETAESRIKNAIADHIKVENFPALFRAAHDATNGILNNICRFIGHRHGNGNFASPDINTKIGAALAARRLTGWVDAFGKDLQRFWQKETWVQGDFYDFNIHVERIMWANGVYVYRGDAGQTMLALLPNELQSLIGRKAETPS